MTGSLKCMCKQDIKAGGILGLYNVRDQEYNFTAINGTEITNVKICASYINDDLKAQALNNGIKYLIIVLNTVIRMVVIKIVTMMGCSTESN